LTSIVSGSLSKAQTRRLAKPRPKRGYQFIAPVIEESTAKPFDLATEAAKKIVGREPALAELDRCLSKAVRGQRQIVFITGSRASEKPR
jgi:hypothetical protein